jgi:hypothetical protein
MTMMRAFHGDPKIKEKYLARVAEHMRLDQVIQGRGWIPERSRGCAVGCTLDAYDHSRYPIELGIPTEVAHVEDRMHELQTLDDARQWPQRFLSAIAPGADLGEVWPKFAIWLLVDDTWGVVRFAEGRADVRAAIERVAELYRIGGTPKQFRAAYAAARAAADDAYAAGWAAYAAARAAAAAGWAADAADARARAIDDAAAAATDAGHTGWVVAARDKLLELLAAAPVVP